MALRRRAPAHDRDPAGEPRSPAPLLRPARGPRGGRPRAWDRVRAQACAQGARGPGLEARAFRCSRCRTRCRSSRSPSARSRDSSTSSTRSSSAGPEVHEQLERLVIEGRGLDAVLSSLAGAVGGTAIVQDAGGRELARQPAKGGPRAAAMKALGAEIAARQASGAITAFEPRQGSLAERALAVPVSGRRGGSPVAWLVVISQQGRLGRVRAADRQAGRDRRRPRAHARACRPGDRAAARRRHPGGGAERPARRR